MIVTPILANFYWGGVVEFGLEDTLGGSLILFGFVAACASVVGLFLFWFCYLFCTKTKLHYRGDDIDVQRKKQIKKWTKGVSKVGDVMNGIKVIKNMKDRVYDPSNKLTVQMQKFKQRQQLQGGTSANGIQRQKLQNVASTNDQQFQEHSVQSNQSMTEAYGNGQHVVHLGGQNANGQGQHVFRMVSQNPTVQPANYVQKFNGQQKNYGNGQRINHQGMVLYSGDDDLCSIVYE